MASKLQPFGAGSPFSYVRGSSSVLDTLRLWICSAPLPGVHGGARLHRAGLRALHLGACAAADRLLERAITLYRRDLRVEAIARARVHQRIARFRQGRNAGEDACLEVERLLYRLPRIERLEPPFDLVDARQLLATWNQPAATESFGSRHEEPRALEPAA